MIVLSPDISRSLSPIYPRQQQQKNTEMIHTFSPNWYRPQCLLFLPNHLLYASNYVLYKYNLNTRSIEADKCFRKIAIKYAMNSKEIKIHTIGLINGKILVGTNQGMAVILSKEDLDVQAIVDICGTKMEEGKGETSNGIAHCSVFNQKPHPFAIFLTQSHKLYKLCTSSLTPATPTPIPSPYPTSSPQIPQHPKQLFRLPNTILLLSTKGSLTIYNKDFTKMIQNIKSQHIGIDNQYVLSVDWNFMGGVGILAGFTRRSGGNFLYLWAVVEENGEEQGGMEEGQGKFGVKVKLVMKTQVKVVYPKIMTEKIKHVQKAAMTIKLLDNRHILLTGKLGQLFIIDTSSPPQSQLITLKPQSIEQVPPNLEILPDPKHYKQIYHIATHIRPQTPTITNVYTISIDQTMCVWEICYNSGSGHGDCLMSQHPSLEFRYSVKFLTSELSAVFYAEADPRTVFLLLRDSNVRSMVPFGTNAGYLAEYWKFTKKWKIIKCVGHLTEVGIVAMLTQCAKVLIYDLYEDRLMKIYDLEINNPNDQIINLSFEHTSIFQPLSQLSTQICSQPTTWHPLPLKSTTYHSKPISPTGTICLLIQQKSSLTIITTPAPPPPVSSQIQQQQKPPTSIKQKQKVYRMKRVCRIQRVHNTKVWDGESLLMSMGKAGKIVVVWVFWANRMWRVQVGLRVAGRVVFQVRGVAEGVLRVMVVEYKGRKVALHWFEVSPTQTTPIKHIQIDLPQLAQQAVLDPHSPQALFYNPKQDQLTLLKFASLPQTQIKILQTGSKIESLAFYFSDHIVAGFKDQSLKVLRLNQMEGIRDQPAKRVKRAREVDGEGEKDRKGERERERESGRKGKIEMQEMQKEDIMQEGKIVKGDMEEEIVDDRIMKLTQ